LFWTLIEFMRRRVIQKAFGASLAVGGDDQMDEFGILGLAGNIVSGHTRCLRDVPCGPMPVRKILEGVVYALVFTGL
jgi:hypothetical protein